MCTAYIQGHPCKGTLNINHSIKISQALEESKYRACGVPASAEGRVGTVLQLYSVGFL